MGRLNSYHPLDLGDDKISIKENNLVIFKNIKVNTMHAAFYKG